jgi:putative ABC transport system permease protein
VFLRLITDSFARQPRRKLLTTVALALGTAIATATLTVALDVGDRLAREFRSLGANLLVTPEADTLPLEIGGVDYRPVDSGVFLSDAELGKLKTIFWRNNVIGFAPFLDVPVSSASVSLPNGGLRTTLIGTWYRHNVAIPNGGGVFSTGVASTNPG